MDSREILTTPQISAAVIELIDETEEFCFLVSPYYKPWRQLQRALQRAKTKKRQVTMIYRADQNSHQLDSLLRDQESSQYELILVEKLHAKLYLNERRAIISSMNLYNSSEEQNIEIGYLVSQWNSRVLLQKVIQERLLDDPSAKVYPGWFHTEMERKRAEVIAFFAGLETRGFCVICGKHHGFQRSGSWTSPHIVRCKRCWLADTETPVDEIKSSYCYYCGKPFEGTCSFPLHPHCENLLEEMQPLKWMVSSE